MVYFLLFFRSIFECEMLVRAAYQKNGLVYRESSSEDEGGGRDGRCSEVIEIDDDDDDDVIAVGCCKLFWRLVLPCTETMELIVDFFLLFASLVVPPKKSLTPSKDPEVRSTKKTQNFCIFNLPDQIF